MELTIHVDGGARGNPGPAGAGVVIHEQNGELIYEAAFFLGEQTNNVAEYTALLRALEHARACGAQAVTVYSDSELLVRQLTGEYRVRNARLAELYQRAQLLLLKVPRWSVRHVRREANARADELANLAMDHRRDLVVFDRDGGDTANTPTPQADGLGHTKNASAPQADSLCHTGDEADSLCHTEDEADSLGRTEDATEAPVGKVAAPRPGEPAIRVTVATSPDTDCCPAGGLRVAAFTISTALPAGLCVHAAHALLPTVLAMLNTEPQEFSAVPTLTVRCGQPGCGAVFQLSPVVGSNGAPRRTKR